MRAGKKICVFVMMVLLTVGISVGVLKPEQTEAEECWVWGPYQVGDNVYARLDSNDTLYVYGEGAIYDGGGLPEDQWGPFQPDKTFDLPDGSWVRNHVKKVIFEDGITHIGQLFAPFETLESVELPSTLESIGNFAFENSKISTIEFPDSLKSIGNYAFAYTKLHSVRIPEGVTHVGACAFECEELTEIYISSSVEEMWGDAFTNFSRDKSLSVTLEIDERNPFFSSYGNLILSKDGKTVISCVKRYGESLEIPEGVEKIQYDSGLYRIDYVFRDSSYSEVVFPETMKELGDELLAGAIFDYVEKPVFPEGLQSIGKSAFANAGILELYLPDTLQKIEERAFAKNDFSAVTLPRNCVVGAKAFMDCKNLKYVEIPENVQVSIAEAFNGCEALECIVLNNDIEHIDNWQSIGAESLKVVVLPDSVSQIDAYGLGYVYSATNGVSKCENLVIYGKPGSVVEEYAIENGFTFKDSATFQRPKKLAKSEGLTFSLSQTVYNYANKAWRPVVTIKDGDYTLVKGVDYVVSYENNKEVGTARVTVTGLNSYNDGRCYTGSKYFSYKINPRPTTITKLAADSKGFTATIKKQATLTSGYQLRYSTNEDMAGAKTVTIADNTICKKKITKLKSKQKYYVQVRTYTVKDGKKYYSAWSNAKTVVTK